jgi:hypothetical protein
VHQVPSNSLQTVAVPEFALDGVLVNRLVGHYFFESEQVFLNTASNILSALVGDLCDIQSDQFAQWDALVDLLNRWNR